MSTRLSFPALSFSVLVCAALLACGPTARAQSASPAFADLQRDWQVIEYGPLKDSPEREPQLAALAGRARGLLQQYPNDAEAHIWAAVSYASWAGAKGGLAALDLARQSKAEYETAIKLDRRALHGSALCGLAILYQRVPGWPVGFGDSAKAEQLFKQALAIDPQGIDPNFYYANFLIDGKRYADAIPYLETVLNAPARADRASADQSHKTRAAKMLEEARRLAPSS